MKGTTALFVSGGLALLGGLIAILFPMPASLAVAVFVGWMFLLSGVFGLWVGFSDPAVRRLHLAVNGEVIPLITGQPAEPIVLQSLDVNVTWTNRFTLTPTDAQTKLGAPLFQTNANVTKVSFTFFITTIWTNSQIRFPNRLIICAVLVISNSTHLDISS